MSFDLIKVIVRYVLIALGSVLSTGGVVTPEEWGQLADSVVTGIGAVAAIGAALWGLKTRMKAKSAPPATPKQ